jgi:hypothetical protein
MSLTPDEQALDIEQMLNRIEEIIVSEELPNNLAGDLMSQSLHEFHERLSVRIAELQDRLKK